MRKKTARVRLRHRSRIAQIPIWLGKRFRGFIYMNDWKMLPMAAVIAALVSMVIRRNMFVNMEGTLMGAFALTCVGIWNGCFNAIQVICRERGIVKREHRSGMHISSYVIACMIYQAVLCLAQSALTVFVCRICGVRFPDEGFMTSSMLIEIGVSIFLVTYASDMLSMLISAVARSTTAAMTVMPFLLIFQLVFSGGFFSLPQWAQGLSGLTLSRFGMNAICVQADYNNLPMKAGWTALEGMQNETVEGTVKLGELAGLLGTGTVSADQQDPESLTEIMNGFTENPLLKDVVEQDLHYSFRIGDVLDKLGRDDVRKAVQERTSVSSRRPDYNRTRENVWNNWFPLIGWAFLYAAIAIFLLEFIDRDKR